MKLKLNEPSEFTKGVEIISELVSEVRIKVTEFGLSISAMDPANVSMVGYSLPKEAFSIFEAENQTIGVNLEDLKRILKRCGTKSALIMETTENSLEIIIEDRVRRNFSLGLIEIEREEIDFKTKIERMQFISTATIDSVDLVSSIEDCAIVSDSCNLEVKDGKFIISARGMNSARAEFSDEVEITGENTRSKYSLEYLQKFAKGAKVANKITLKMSNNHPLLFEIKAEHMKLNFVLAPRVETDD